jgi:antitoxin (DNA-binding transcriptional repressor) of toxin-antitoxin stability system
MIEMTVTEFARNMRSVFDRIEHNTEEIILFRNKHRVARIVPGSPHRTALEAMGDLYRTMPSKAGDGWVRQSRIPGSIKEMRDPWGS